MTKNNHQNSVANSEKLENGVTIICCCYNSEHLLNDTFSSLSKLIIPLNTKMELLVVDNNSKDGTIPMAKKSWQKNGAPFPMHILHEDRQGLNFARRRGVMDAKYKYLVFCDDDNWLSKDYVLQVIKFFDQNIKHGIVGGSIKAVSSVAFPNWFSECQGYYAMYEVTAPDFDRKDYGVAGAGMSMRTALAKRIFDQRWLPLCMGPSGANEFRGDDGEICLRARLLDYKIALWPPLSLDHFIEPSRLTISYFEKLKNEGKRDSSILSKYERALAIKKMNVIGKIIQIPYCIIKLCLGRIINKKEIIVHATDYIYFIAGITLFSSPENVTIRNFMQNQGKERAN